MIYATKLYKMGLKAKNFGVEIKDIKLDFNKVLEYTNSLVHNSIQNNEKQLNGISIKYSIKSINYIRELMAMINNESYRYFHEIFTNIYNRRGQSCKKRP